MEIRQTTPPDAYETLQRDPTAVYLDVRTPEEFAAGHPAGAINVPVIFFRAGGSSPNPDFVDGRAAPRAADDAAARRMPGRRALAARRRAAGRRRATPTSRNVRGGFGGARDETGRIVIPGWRDAGLPVETGPGGTTLGPARMAIRITKVYTRHGDKGDTHLVGGRRVAEGRPAHRELRHDRRAELGARHRPRLQRRRARRARRRSGSIRSCARSRTSSSTSAASSRRRRTPRGRA